MRFRITFPIFSELLCLALGLPVIAAWSSGIVRTNLGLGIGTSLIVSIIALLSLYAAARQRLGIEWPIIIRMLLLSAVLFVPVAEIFFFAPLENLVSVGGGDASDHAYYMRQFIEHDPGVYQQMIGFHTLAFWAEEAFKLDLFQTYRAVFYGTLFVLTFLTVLIAYFLIPRRKRLLVILPPFLFTAAVLHRLLFPLLSYLQADGFFPQLLGFAALVIMWVGYALTPSAIGRIFVIFAGLVFVRFTYVLNLGDLCLASGILIGLDRAISPKIRLVIALPLLAGAFLIFSHLLQLIPLNGGVVGYRIELFLIAMPILSLLLLRLPARELFAGTALSRAASFAGAFGLLSSVMQILWWAAGLPTHYYFIKYGFLPVMLLSLAAPIILYGVSTSLLLKGIGKSLCLQWSLWSGEIFVCLLILNYALAPYRPAYAERFAGKLPLAHLQPLADREAWAIIEETLQMHGAKFGGFIGPPIWAQSKFINAGFRYYKANQLPLYRDPHLLMKPGFCVFWASGPGDVELLRVPSKGLAPPLLNRLAKNPATVTVRYTVPWEAGARQLSSLCFKDETTH